MKLDPELKHMDASTAANFLIQKAIIENLNKRNIKIDENAAGGI
ncbi:MAG: hypothetical protein ACQER9_02490 [Nanobdellota archaeon]